MDSQIMGRLTRVRFAEASTEHGTRVHDAWFERDDKAHAFISALGMRFDRELNCYMLPYGQPNPGRIETADVRSNPQRQAY